MSFFRAPRFWTRPVLASLLVAAAACLGGCATTAVSDVPDAPSAASTGRSVGRLLGNARVAPITGKLMSSAELRKVVPGAIVGDRSYAEVNSAWLATWYPIFRSKLFKIGLARWDYRFDCNRFADFYSNLAQAFFSVEMFQSDLPAQALALGPFWYMRDNGQGAHAIIQALTERGRIFIDPQTGQEVKLSSLEKQSGYVQLF
jgi:hypothetical protein